MFSEATASHGKGIPVGRLISIIKNHFLTHARNENVYFTKFPKTIEEDNERVLYVSFFLAPVIYVVLVLLSYWFQGSVDSTTIVFLFIPEQIFYHIYRYFNKKKDPELRHQNLEAFIYYIIYAVQLMLLDTIAFHHSEAMWFSTFLMLLPMVYIDRFSSYFCTNLALSAVHGILVFMIKNPSFHRHDFLFLFIGVSMSTFSAMIVSTIRNAQAIQNQSLREASHFDKLTGLLNKGSAQKEITQYFSQRPKGENCVVISIDADNFKQINDKLGHSSGDIVLSEIGSILKSHFRTDDIVARNGGDEFLVVMKGISPPFHLDTVCRRIQKNVAEIEVDGGWTFTCSLGIVIDTHGKDFDSIFALADDALYECKIRGRDCFTEWYTYDLSIDESKPLIILSTNQHREDVEQVSDFLRNKYNVLYAETGNEILNLSSQYLKSLKVIILDMAIDKIPPDLVLSYIRQRPNFSHLKVVAACPTDEYMEMAGKLNADVVVKVPTQPEKIISAVEKCLSM